MASASIAKVGCVNFKARHSNLQHSSRHQQQFSRNRFVVLCSAKGRDIISIDQRKVNINLPFPRGASLSKSKLEEKFNLETRFRFSLDISVLSKLNTEMQRRSFSVYLIFTAVCLMGPAAALADATDTEIPEYGPGLPKKEITFDGHVFLAKVMRPQALLADERTNALKTDTGFDKSFSTEEGQQRAASEDFDDEPEEVLELSIVVPKAQYCPFDVFINLPNASERSSLTLPEYCGSFGNEVDPRTKQTKVRFGITDTIQRLNLQNEPSILVAIVRRGATENKPITIKDIDIAMDED